jgi:glycosyltransferase involved in cell wall biosynthesis
MSDRRIKLMLAIDGLGIGGAEMVVRDLARVVDRDQFDVSICCTKGLGGEIGEELVRDGFDVFVLPGTKSEKPDYLTSIKMRRAVLTRNIDIVHTHAMSALMDAGVCRVTMPRLRVVHTFHYGNYPYESWRTHLMEGLFARSVDRLIAVGWDQRRRLQSAYRLPESRITVIWNGIRFGPAESGAAFRDQFHRGDRLLVGTLAKLIPQKGLDDLLTVASRCRDAGFRMQFVIVGEGDLRPALEQQLRELQLQDTVTITGWIANAAVRALPAFDVFFQPSRWEAMSIAVLEAMANSKAIVATRVGDNARVLEEGVSGIIVEPGDIDGMVGALSLMRDPAMRQRLGTTARARFEQHFTVEPMVRGYQNVYRELAGLQSAT